MRPSTALHCSEAAGWPQSIRCMAVDWAGSAGGEAGAALLGARSGGVLAFALAAGGGARKLATLRGHEEEVTAVQVGAGRRSDSFLGAGVATKVFLKGIPLRYSFLVAGVATKALRLKCEATPSRVARLPARRRRRGGG
jgi:hypothetical protein